MHQTAFEDIGWSWASGIVSVGTFAALTSSMLVTLMTAARVIFSMARDGLLPEFASYVHPRTHAQVTATILAGILASIPTLFVDITFIGDATSLGNLLVFTGVCFCLIIHRLQQEVTDLPQLRFGIIFTSLLTVAMGFGVAGMTLALYELPLWATASIALLLVVVPIASICLYFWFLVPRVKPKSSFECPLVPLIPLCGIAVNLFMTFNFTFLIWSIVLLWIILGIVLYFVFSIRKSNA